MKIDADNDKSTDGLIVVELNLDQLSYGRAEFMTDFITLFSKQVVNTFMAQLIQASGDASLTEKLFTLRAKIDQASAKCGTSIPDKSSM